MRKEDYLMGETTVSSHKASRIFQVNVYIFTDFQLEQGEFLFEFTRFSESLTSVKVTDI